MIFSSLQLQPPSSSSSSSGGNSKDKSSPARKKMRALNEFTNKFLKPDIVLVLKIIAANVNGLVVSELVKYLWEAFLRMKEEENEKEYDQNNNDRDDVDLEEDDYDRDDEKAAAFPISRQPVVTNTETVGPENTTSGPIKRALGFKSAKSDASAPTKKANDDNTGAKPTTSTTTSIV